MRRVELLLPTTERINLLEVRLGVNIHGVDLETHGSFLAEVRLTCQAAPVNHYSCRLSLWRKSSLVAVPGIEPGAPAPDAGDLPYIYTAMVAAVGFEPTISCSQNRRVKPFPYAAEIKGWLRTPDSNRNLRIMRPPR